MSLILKFMKGRETERQREKQKKKMSEEESAVGGRVPLNWKRNGGRDPKR